MKISVIGTGYVGLVTGTCFAEMGNTVTCIDIDQNKVNKMKEGISPIYEPGLEALLKQNIQANRIFFETSYDSIKEASVIFMAVGTPPRDDGSADLKYLYSALDSIIPLLNEEAIVVLKSTVPVGTNNDVRNYISKNTSKNIHIVNNPEFLKEGSAVNDFMKPERVIIGTEDDEVYKIMEELYAPFMYQESKMVRMSNISAELSKYAANSFLATKISFMNEIARLCDRTGADVEEVRAGIATDSRIGGQFLYPGPGYGGSCFPKDVKALIYTAKKFDLDLEIINATERVNADQKLYMFNKIMNYFGGKVKGKTITFWGVAFKANTDDIRETPAINIAHALHQEGAKIKFYDPVASDNFENFVASEGLHAEKVDDKYEALNNSDALLILTEWKEFRSPDFNEIKSRLNRPVLFDGRNLYHTQSILKEGFDYHSVGKKVD